MSEIEKRASFGEESAFVANEKNNLVQTDYNPKIQKHKIYDALLSFLEDKRIRTIGETKALPFILHEKTKAYLRETDGLSEEDLTKLEKSIFRDAESLSGFEVIRNVPRRLYNDLKQRDEAYLIDWNRIVPLPNFIENACICAALKEQFSGREILSCPGFITVYDRDENGIILSAIRLDIDERLVRNGFMMPIYSNALITALLVFRHPNDEKPFLLRSRRSNLGGENNGEQSILQTN